MEQGEGFIINPYLCQFRAKLHFMSGPLLMQDVSAQIQADPENAGLYFKRAELHRLHGELEESAADYDRVARMDSSFVAVHLGRGKLLLEIGNGSEHDGDIM